ncbi:MAG: EamA family transporter [Candidatus Dormibacteria bacterium]
MRVAGLAPAMRLGRRVGFGDHLIVMATLVWSVNVVAVKVALAGSGPLTYSALRYILGGLAVWALARWLEGPLPLPRGRAAGLIALAAASGVLVNQASFTWSLALTNADNSPLQVQLGVDQPDLEQEQTAMSGVDQDTTPTPAADARRERVGDLLEEESWSQDRVAPLGQYRQRRHGRRSRIRGLTHPVDHPTGVDHRH